MPKLSYPGSMTDLEGKTLDGSPMQENFQALQNLLDTGLDWENIQQWSLDTHHVGHANNDPNDGYRLKQVASIENTAELDPAFFTVPGEWFSFSKVSGQVTPQIPPFVVEDGGGIFIIGSCTSIATGRAEHVEFRVRVKKSGFSWATIWHTRGGNMDHNSGCQGIVAAKKVQTGGLYYADVQVRYVREGVPFESTPSDGSRPLLFADPQAAVFVLNL